LSRLPLALTLFRLAAGPVIAILALWANAVVLEQGPHAGATLAAAAFGLFVLAGVSDWLDGALARKLDAVTSLGAALDHAADKALAAATLLGLAAVSLPADLVIAGSVILARDFAIAGLREAQARPGLSVGMLGKVKAALAMLGIGAALAHQPIALLAGPEPLLAAADLIARLALWAAAALALASAWFYLRPAKE
jgi:cardiolipin synthase (CMP-forming)